MGISEMRHPTQWGDGSGPTGMWIRVPSKESHLLAMETGLQKMLEKQAMRIANPLLDGLLLFPLYSGEEIRLEAHFKSKGD